MCRCGSRNHECQYTHILNSLEPLAMGLTFGKSGNFGYQETNVLSEHTEGWKNKYTKFSIKIIYIYIHKNLIYLLEISIKNR